MHVGESDDRNASSDVVDDDQERVGAEALAGRDTARVETEPTRPQEEMRESV